MGLRITPKCSCFHWSVNIYSFNKIIIKIIGIIVILYNMIYVPTKWLFLKVRVISLSKTFEFWFCTVWLYSFVGHQIVVGNSSLKNLAKLLQAWPTFSVLDWSSDLKQTLRLTRFVHLNWYLNDASLELLSCSLNFTNSVSPNFTKSLCKLSDSDPANSSFSLEKESILIWRSVFW